MPSAWSRAANARLLRPTSAAVEPPGLLLADTYGRVQRSMLASSSARESDAGPRVRITLDGKFLPYTWEG